MLYHKKNDYQCMVSSAVWLVEFSCATVTKSSKEAVADPTWVQATIATKVWYMIILLYMGTV